LGKNLILWQILFTKLKSYVEKLLYIDVKSIFVDKKINIYHPILPISSQNLTISPKLNNFLKLKELPKTQG